MSYVIAVSNNSQSAFFFVCEVRQVHATRCVVISYHHDLGTLRMRTANPIQIYMGLGILS